MPETARTTGSLSGRRYGALAALGILWIAALSGRLFFLQVLHFREFFQRAQKQQQRTIEVSPRRGVLYDRNFRELAMSVQVDSVFAAPGEIPQPENTVALLAGVLQLDAGALRRRLLSGRQFCWVKRKVDPVEAARVQALNLKGVYLQKEDKRFYPKGDLAAHLLGYVGMDENGLAGIEQQFDSQVRGRPGQLLIQADARHRWFGRKDEKAPDVGANVVLALDEKVQFIVEREISSAMEQTHSKAITVVVMDPQNGELLALANRPTFNPNARVESEESAWQNRAISASYEPGSTMKIITISAALEEKLARPEEMIDCQMGAINVFGRVIHDHKAYGLLSVTQVMANSSDVGAIKLGLRLGNERMYRYMRAFGLGTPTGVELPGEERGLTKPPERWSKSSVGSISMGQELGATPLQMASAISVIASEGILYRPRIVRQIFRPAEAGPFRNPGLDGSVMAAPGGARNDTVSSEGKRVISPETALEVRKMLEQVVLVGTGKVARLNGYTSAGKTGTAQKYDPNTGTYSKTDYVASFIGFAPVNKPAVTIAVILDSPAGMHQGGQAAAPIFKRIAEKVLAHLEIPHDVPVAGEPPAEQVEPEQVSDFSPPEEIAESNTGPANRQSAIPNAQLEVVDLEGAALVPEFLGKSLRVVAEQALAKGLEVELIGSGVAREQAPAPGARLLPGRKITVKFSR